MALFSHPDCAGHDPVPGHPEQPARLAAALAAFDDPALSGCPRLEAPLAAREDLLSAHAAAHVDRVFEAGRSGSVVRLDPDTAIGPGSLDAALRAAGAVIAAVDHVLGGAGRRAFCAVRPPGHHATRRLAMGFCQFNSIAVGAAHALARHGLSRVAVVDFDVHHGNGSQAIFWDEPRVLFASSHQWPLYPGSGALTETGASANIANAPLPPGAGSAAFRTAWTDLLLPRIDDFAPELLLVSAGFDGHRDDPLGGLRLETGDFAWLTAALVALAERHADGRVVSSLEGGYDLGALTACTRAHALALIGPGQP
ncbi:MAG: histone deacetylase family protein, partial [Xanthomonadales bacterium]|nr:histone deacetylase family protein [Xanthomonadales bacterium]